MQGEVFYNSSMAAMLFSDESGFKILITMRRMAIDIPVSVQGC